MLFSELCASRFRLPLCSRVILENLTFAQLENELPSQYSGTQKLISIFKQQPDNTEPQ